MGAEHPEVVPSLNNLATIYLKQEKYEQAEELLQRAIAIYKKANHPDLVVSMSNLAQLYEKQERYNLAEITTLEVINILEDNPSSELLRLLPFYEDLSKIYCFSEKYDRAESFLQKALTIREQQLELEEEAIAVTLSNLGFLCEMQGKNTQAEQFYGKALRCLRATVKPNHPSLTLVSYHYNNVIKKTNNIATKSFKEENSTRNKDKYIHQSTQKSKKKKRKKQR